MTDQRREDIKENLTITKRLLKWVSPMTHKAFAEKYIHLPSNNAFDAGRLIDFRKSPHLIKPLAMADNPKVQEIYLMFASQMAKTLFLFIIFALIFSSRFNTTRKARKKDTLHSYDNYFKKDKYYDHLSRM